MLSTVSQCEIMDKSFDLTPQEIMATDVYSTVWLLPTELGHCGSEGLDSILQEDVD